MSVYKPAKSRFWHYDFKFKGHRYHGSTNVTAKRDAQRVEDDKRREAALGTQAKPTISVETACDTWQATVGDFYKMKDTTLYQLAYIMSGLGPTTPLHDVSFKDLQDYGSIRRSHVSDTSVNREFQLFRRVVNWTAPRGFEVPAIEWRKLMFKEPKGRTRELSADEQDKLFAALPDNLKPLVEFALLSGQRKTEIIMLRWADVDMRGKRAKLWTKGGDPHTIPLTSRMVDIISQQPKVCPQVFTYICQRPAPKRKDRPARRKGERYPFSRYGWMRQWQKALSDAGIDDYRFHDNRHTAATRYLRASGNLKSVSVLLGHSDVTTTSRYAHALEGDVRAMMEQRGEALRDYFGTSDDDSRLVPPQDAANNG